MNILLIGPQGSGKGTQAKLLSGKYDFFYFEAGEFLRKIASKNKNVKRTLDEGKLLPEKEVASYIQAFFDEKQIWDNIVFDGFPRTTKQYKFFKTWLDGKKTKIHLVIVLEVNETTTIKRLSLRKREDDTKEAIKERLSLYRKETLPLISELKRDSKVFYIDGERSIEEIQSNIERVVNEEVNN